MALSDEFLDDLRRRADIESTVSSYVSLKRKGKILTGLCPFHNEKTPSFTVYPETQSYYCFGCGNGGDVITFIRNIENLDYMEAVKLLADRHGVSMPQDGYDSGLSKKRTEMYGANREAARFFHAKLYSPEGRQGLEYFYSRGLTDDTIRHFGLGYAPDSKDELIEYLISKGYSQQLLYDANILRLSERYNKKIYYNAFRKRAMFPIIDLRGNVIAFSGRRIHDADSDRKYVNTSDTLVYKKGSNLFALNFAKKSKSDSIILCEGNLDVISLHQAGFTNAVAGLGTALTEEQAHLLSHYAGEIFICYDSDEAGQKATRKAINILGKTTLKVRIIHMTGGKDPDEIIQKFGAEGFKRCLDSAANDVEFSLLSERSKYDISSPAGRSDYLKAAAAVLASLNSPVELDIYISRLSEEFSVNKDAVAAQVKIEREKRAKKQKNEFYREVRDSVINQGDKINKVNTQRSKALRAAKAEEILIASFMSDPELYRKLESKLTPELFVTDFNRRVFSAISERIKDGRPVGLSFFASEFTPEEISVIARIETVSTDISNSVRECEDCINVLKKEKNRHIDVKPSEMSDEDFMKLFK
ncbi:MAG: DNA primase [Ruminococcaceae bacterium]|jgi:DNA primase|nr:DNA primase [Oscillospiraceae bacterium]